MSWKNSWALKTTTLSVLKNPELWLRKGADRRLRGGHCWLYSNEVDTDKSPLKQYVAGALVNIHGAGGELLGTAYMEPESLICARLVSRHADATLDASYFRQRISRALELRQRVYGEPFYRLVYGDSDGLSGVVVDRFGEQLVLQLNTAGMDSHADALIEALVEELAPTGILLRTDSRSRREQGLPSAVSTVFGQVPEHVELLENGVRFSAPVVAGQKTGWFYDHRENRARLRDWVPGKRVLDVYSYIGGWGVQTAAFGAGEVTCIDSSAPALEQVMINAGLNQVADRVDTCQGQATAVMAQMVDTGRQFDVVILDPPAFIQRKRDLGKGRKAYRRINELGMRLLAPNGLLVSASCSMQLSHSDLVGAIQGAAVRTQREVRIVASGFQGCDHPVHPAIPETEYLKAIYSLVMPAN